ncbi:LppA family lipoprotein [Mycolicibacterium xanthum]|uniref:LppA family lipoprotein n=1 Tax=Mycolicibacterium xanthum TaxID=2796469 RepID=UPI0021032BB5|nr:LppA family lipoprotein [Mycolicibacterium xanthum]
MTERRRIAAAAILVCTSTLIGGCSLTENPYESKTVGGDDAIALIDGMRARGSFEAARQRLNAAAATIADRITAAVPGQTWHFSEDPNVVDVKQAGLPCEKLTGDIARRPMSDLLEFGRTFDAGEFGTANEIVRDEAAKVGATDESSLFNDQARRDLAVQGNGYEFKLSQGGSAILNITGDCHLMQSVVELPPGQLPPEPPIVPSAPPPTTPTP